MPAVKCSCNSKAKAKTKAATLLLLYGDWIQKKLVEGLQTGLEFMNNSAKNLTSDEGHSIQVLPAFLGRCTYKVRLSMLGIQEKQWPVKDAIIVQHY